MQNKRIYFRPEDRMAGNLPQPEQFPLDGSFTTGDTRADLSDIRARLRTLQGHLPEHSTVRGELRTAMDALNLALSKIVVEQMSRTWERKSK